jgi:hypothetical protein
MSEQRFRDASWPCQHNQHALATGQRGIGLAAIPKWTDLALDFGNNIYAQVQRVLKYLKTRYLGDDSAPYKGPWSGTVRAYYGAVDATDRILAALLPGDLLTLDRSVTEEFQNDYEIIARRVIRPAQGSSEPKMLEFDLLQYVPSSFIDNPDASPGIASPVPRAGLIISGGPANGSYRPTADPLTATDAGTTATINIASVPMRFAGISPDPVYGSGAVTGLSFATQYFIYADDPDRQGGAVAYAATTTKENALSQSGWLFMGSIITPNDGAGDTQGNGDGGAGAQVGRLFTTLPGTYTITPAAGCGTIRRTRGPDTNSYADVTTASTGGVRGLRFSRALRRLRLAAAEDQESVRRRHRGQAGRGRLLARWRLVLAQQAPRHRRRRRAGHRPDRAQRPAGPAPGARPHHRAAIERHAERLRGDRRRQQRRRHRGVGESDERARRA